VLQLLVFFAISLAVHVTVVAPSGKLVPAPEQLMTVEPQLSCAVAPPSVALAPAPLEHSTVTGAGHVSFGGSLSTTVTVPGHLQVAPLLSVTVSVTDVVPTLYGPAGDWVTVIVSPGSGSDDPLSMEAGAAHSPGLFVSVTFLQRATGGVSGAVAVPTTTLAVLLMCVCLAASTKLATAASVPSPAARETNGAWPAPSGEGPLTKPALGPDITAKITCTPGCGMPLGSTTVAVRPTKLPDTIFWVTGLTPMPEAGSAQGSPSGFQSCWSIRSKTCRRWAL